MSMGCPWATHELLINYAWATNLPTGYAWATHGLRIGYRFTAHRLAMEMNEGIRGLPMGYALTTIDP